MKKKIGILFFTLIILGCTIMERNNCKIEIYNTQGIPKENQSFSYMYFKDENEGYLFGTENQFEEFSEADINNPEFIPKVTNEANIYKTSDGGKSWLKTDSIHNRKFLGQGVYKNNSFYIGLNDFYQNNFYILKKELKNNLLVKPMQSLFGVFSKNDTVFVSSKNVMILLNNDLEIIDSLKLRLGNDVLICNNNIYTILSNSIEDALVVYKDSVLYNINLPITSLKIAQLSKEKILIAGEKKNTKNTISLLGYDVNTRKTELIKEFEGYSIVQSLQSNDKVIVGFIGNITGVFTEYDLVFSLDKGKTWEIMKLKELSYIRPSCLINNTLYIYSGGARMQKVIFE